MPNFSIRRAGLEDMHKLMPLRTTLWPGPDQEHIADLGPLLQGSDGSSFPCAVFIAESDDGSPIGFLEAGQRSHADGCDSTHPVGYVEGWFVVESWRRRGVAARLLSAAEDWAREQGCSEMASDTWIDNDVSQRTHEALGFEVVDRCIVFRKTLSQR